jgi:hypothetical protein
MPTVLRWRGYRFYFFSNEGNEPAHIHIDKAGNTVKYWLQPVSPARQIGFSAAELRELEEKVRGEQGMLIEAWNGYFRNHR